MAIYTGSRPIHPGQNTNDWRDASGEVGVYSNRQLRSSTHLLQDAPLRHVEPGAGDYPGDAHLSQMYTGTHRYSPMELRKNANSDAPYLKHERLLFHGVPAAEVFPDGFGHDGTREFNFSRYTNYEKDGVPSAFELDGGHAARGYGAGAANLGPHDPWRFQGVGTDALELDPDEKIYGFEDVNIHQGVPSAKAL